MKPAPVSVVASHDADRFKAASGHFARFFNELAGTFVEREQILAQFALALLAREHLLMTGPPGTAKSQLAASVLRRIVDESTGKPSVFARQFTENTVQTDLIGPIDFKTLLEKGRTEHFTDEGMLGEVHAFLDEVFDGRDMLLRSTLNLLLERELKQGGRTTQGRIEAAFMTSNRYIAEVLESSREVLLAFLDRIAFVSFVPRGFADAGALETVVKRQAGGRTRPRLTSPLSIQDIDVLQHAVENVFVSDSICKALVNLVESLDAELAQAAKADPGFLPTRYFSTRTVVRAVHVLRAIAVYQKIFHEPDRPLEVVPADLSLLHLHLLLAGMPPDKIALRLARESDPRERRQLEIARTEREIFDRCLKKLPPITQASPVAKAIDLAALRRSLEESERYPDPSALAAVATQLAFAAASGATGAERASELFDEAVASMTGRALRAGLAPDAGSLLTLVDQLSKLADGLEAATPEGRETGRWLRGRALTLIDQSGTLAPEGVVATVTTLSKDATAEQIAAQAETRLAAVEAIAAARVGLQAAGAAVADPEEAEASWKRGVKSLEEEQALLWDAMLRANASAALGEAKGGKLVAALAALAPSIDRVDAIEARLHTLTGEASGLKARVFAPRLRPILAAAFDGMKATTRRAVVDEVKAIRGQVVRSGLGTVIDPGIALGWAAAALVRNDKIESNPSGKGYSPDAVQTMRRGDGEHLSSLQALLEIALVLDPGATSSPAAPATALQRVKEMLRSIPTEIATRLATGDLARLAAPVTYLEGWWNELTREKNKKPVAVLEAAVQSGFLGTLRDEDVLLGIPRSANAVADAFPERGADAAEITKRLAALDAACTDALIRSLQAKSDESWSALLKK